jgi:exosome complex RNA-binding protein Rrp42 (RNase PH superfamily)
VDCTDSELACAESRIAVSLSSNGQIFGIKSLGKEGRFEQKKIYDVLLTLQSVAGKLVKSLSLNQ